jgi:molybdopterin converting factor small subunit
MQVRLFGTLCPATGGSREAQLHVGKPCTAREALALFVTAHPGLDGRVLDENQELERGLNLFVGGRSIRLLDGLGTLLTQDDELLLVPLLGGG